MVERKNTMLTVALHALLLILLAATSDPFLDTAPASSDLTMILWYACMGCYGGPTISPLTKLHLSTMPERRACKQSFRGIVILPNRPADNKAGGSEQRQHERDPLDMERPRAGLYTRIRSNLLKISINSLYFSL